MTRIVNDTLVVMLAFLFAANAFILGFYVGRDYAADKKKSSQSVYHTHLHIGKTNSVPTNKGMFVNYEDKQCLAKNIYFEAATESALGKVAVGLVVMNRVKDDRYPSNVCDVVNQRSQFSWVNDSRSNVPPRNNRAWKESLRLSEEILKGNAKFIGFDQVTHYHANYVNPGWSKKLRQVAKIDQHIFYR